MEKNLKKSILVIAERYYPENFLINDLVQEWVKMGIQVHVLTQVPSYPQDKLFPGYLNSFSEGLENGVLVTRFKTVLGYKTKVIRKILNYFMFMVRVVYHSIRCERSFDTVFVYHTGPLTQALPVVFLKTFFRKHVAIWSQDIWPDTVFAYGVSEHGVIAAFLKLFVRCIYTHCDNVAVSSPGFIARLKPYVSKETSVAFIPQWVPEEFDNGIDSGLLLSGNGKKFIFAGNIGKMQNLENLILAFKEFDKETALLYILGDGSNREYLENLVSNKEIRNVIFLGSTDQNKVKHCLEQCDFSVLSLSSDKLIGLTIPAKFQVYLSAGRPILAVTDGEVRKIVTEEHIGVCSVPDDIPAIVDAIRSLSLTSPDGIQLYRKNMEKLLDSNFNKAHNVAELTLLLDRVSLDVL